MRKIKRMMQVFLCTILFGSVFYFSSGDAIAKDTAIVVEKGDTLYSLAKAYHTTVDALKAANQLNNNTIYVGQELLVPNQEIKSMYAVMAGSFTKKKNADKRVSLLKKEGIDAVLDKRIMNGKTYYRVQAGVFSKKSNAEKVKKTLEKIGIKDAYILSKKPLHINQFTLDSTYQQLILQFGKPMKTEDHLEVRSVYYMEEGAAIRVTFNMMDGSIKKLQVYPEYFPSTKVPTTKEQINTLYGYPNAIKKVSCYESATCTQQVYQFHQEQLTVQFDRDGEIVQFLDLEKLD